MIDDIYFTKQSGLFCNFIKNNVQDASTKNLQAKKVYWASVVKAVAFTTEASLPPVIKPYN